MTYNNAKTSAELYKNVGRISSDFTSLINMQAGKAYHVVYGNFGESSYGAGNNLLFRIDTDRVYTCGFSTNLSTFDLGLPISSTETETVWNDAFFKRTTYSVSNNGMTDFVWNLKITRNGKTVCNYYMVPVSF